MMSKNNVRDPLLLILRWLLIAIPTWAEHAQLIVPPQLHGELRTKALGIVGTAIFYSISEKARQLVLDHRF